MQTLLNSNDRRMASFAAHNAGRDLRAIDLFAEAKPAGAKALDWSGSDPAAVMPTLKAHQRLLRVTAAPAAVAKLHDLGFTSAHGIASLPEEEFVARATPALAGGADEARRLHARSTSIKAKVAHLWANLHQLRGSRFARALRADNVSPEVAAYFDSVPSYQDIFGSLDYCDCEE